MFKTIPINKFPELDLRYQKFLDVITKVNYNNPEINFMIKGGLSRLILLECILETGITINRNGDKITNQKWRMGAERNIHDIDLIILHRKTLPKSEVAILEGIDQIRTKAFNIGLYLDPSDIEFAREKSLITHENTIKNILDNRDLTINQNVLEYRDGKWYIHYTRQCYRHLVNGIGMLAKKKWGTLRLDSGRYIPTSYGLIRLLKFWVEGKVVCINLPQWMIDIHLKEMQNNDKMPLGNFGAFLAETYSEAHPAIQERWIRVLNHFKLTILSDFEVFRSSQLSFYRENNGKEFILQKRTPEDVYKAELEKRENKEAGIKQRKEARNQCNHVFEKITCKGCKHSCVFQKCTQCTAFTKSANDFPCNIALIEGNEKFVGNQFRYFPQKS